MTREEAIRQIEQVGWTLNDFLRDAERDALDLAIEALENEPVPCEKCIHVKSCRKVIILKNRTYKLIRYCSQGAERKKL